MSSHIETYAPELITHITEWFIADQREDGSFNYERDIITGLVTDDNNLVQQAGSLYALAQSYHYKQTLAL